MPTPTGQPTIAEVESALNNPNQQTLAQAYPTNGAFQAGAANQQLSNLQASVANSDAITLDQLNPIAPITVPQAPLPNNEAPAAVAGGQAMNKTLTDYIKEATPPETETSKKYDKLAGDLETLLPGLTGRGADQTKAENDAGIPVLNKQLAELNSDIEVAVAELNKKNAEYEKEIARIETQPGMLTSIATGQQGAVRKLQLAEHNSKSADILLMQARANGLLGRVNAAQKAVDRAIDLKYQDREATVNLKMDQLKLLEGKLNKEEQITAKALERKYADEKEKIKEEKDKAKENINLAFSANVQTKYANKGGEWFRVSDGKTFATPDELFKDAGIKSFDQLYKTGLVTDLNASRVADIEFVQQLRAKYPDAGITINDSATTATQKLNKSRIYLDEVRGPVGSTGGTLGGTSIVDSTIDAGVKNLIAANLKSGYGSAFEAVKAKYGDAVAQSYDKVYQDVFNKGVSIDAAFNNAKLGAASNKLVDASGKEVKLTPAQQSTISDWDTLADLVGQTKTLGERIGFSGTGGFGQGSVSQFLAKQGISGSQEEEQLRNLITNIKGTLAKARGGTSFTPNEQKLLDSYTPGINDSVVVLKAKLDSLTSFISTAKKNIYNAAGVVNSTGNSDPLGIR